MPNDQIIITVLQLAVISHYFRNRSNNIYPSPEWQSVSAGLVEQYNRKLMALVGKTKSMLTVKRGKEAAHCCMHGPGASKSLRESRNSRNAPHYYSGKYSKRDTGHFPQYIHTITGVTIKFYVCASTKGVIRFPVDVGDYSPTTFLLSTHSLQVSLSSSQIWPISTSTKRLSPVKVACWISLSTFV